MNKSTMIRSTFTAHTQTTSITRAFQVDAITSTHVKVVTTTHLFMRRLPTVRYHSLIPLKNPNKQNSPFINLIRLVHVYFSLSRADWCSSFLSRRRGNIEHQLHSFITFLSHEAAMNPMGVIVLLHISPGVKCVHITLYSFHRFYSFFNKSNFTYFPKEWGFIGRGVIFFKLVLL
jgi:hypothetical protein